MTDRQTRELSINLAIRNSPGYRTVGELIGDAKAIEDYLSGDQTTAPPFAIVQDSMAAAAMPAAATGTLGTLAWPLTLKEQLAASVVLEGATPVLTIEEIQAANKATYDAFHGNPPEAKE